MAQLDVVLTYFEGDKNIFTKEKIEELIKKEGKVLKDTSRSFVKLIEFNETKMLIKRPIEKNQRRWIRFLTLFRKSEAVRVLESMELLNKNGVLTNQALLAVEYKKNGMVYDSYIFSSYVDGKIVTKERSRDVIEVIKKIHKLGYLHGDTQVRNFLENKGKVYTIDSTLKKKSFGAISENLEYIGFAVDIEEAYAHIDRKNINFKIADFIYKFFRGQRRLKKKIKDKIRGKKSN